MTRFVLASLCLAQMAAAAPQAAAWRHAELRFEQEQAGVAAARGLGYGMRLTAGGAALRLGTTALEFRFEGARTAAHMELREALPGLHNYFFGRDPRAWRSGVRAYGKARFEGVYPGVDIIYYGNQGELEYDLTLGPGASLDAIAFTVRGAARTRLGADGALELAAGAAAVRLHAPVAYQETAAGRRRVACRYALAGNRVHFVAADWDRARALVIDPVISFAAAVGGTRDEEAKGVAADKDGNTYLTGATASADLPGTAGSAQPAKKGWSDAFVAKLGADGRLAWATYLGGSSGATPAGIAVDAAGNVYVTGYTSSRDFPVTGGAYQTQSEGSVSAFVTKLGPAGNALVYSTYFGSRSPAPGSCTDVRANAIAVDLSGAAHIAGRVCGTIPATAGAYQTQPGGNVDAFAAKFSAGGNALQWATYLGGGYQEEANALALDGAGNVWLAGATGSADFPVRGALPAGYKSVGVFKTSDGGANWQAAVNGLNGSIVYNVTADPRTAGTVYAGTMSAGAFKSTDGGGAWAAVNNGLALPPPGTTGPTTYSFAVHPQSPQNLYRADIAEVLVSQNGGASWTKAAPLLAGGVYACGRITQLLLDPRTPAVMYAALDACAVPGAIYKTTDNGSTWTLADNGLGDPHVEMLAIDPANPSTLYAATHQGVWKSVNGGGSWARSSAGLGSDWVHTVAVNPATPAVVYAGVSGSGAFFRSTDFGANWTASNAGLTASSITSVAVAPSDPQNLYATGWDGAYRSRDGGLTWSAAKTGLTSYTVRGVAVDATNPNVAYLGSYGYEDAFVARLDAAGKTLGFATLLGGGASDVARALAVDAGGNVLVAGSAASADFPFTSNLAAGVWSGRARMWVARLAGGSQWEYIVALGPGTANGVAAAADGSVWVAGTAGSGAALTADALQGSYKGGDDAYVAQLKAGALAYGSYFGGSDSDSGVGVALLPGGAVALAGSSRSSSLPVAGLTGKGGSDAFVVALKPDPVVQQLGLSLTSKDLSAETGGAPVTERVELTSGGVAVDFTAASSAAWLKVAPASGQTPAALTLTVDPAGLTPGNYTGTVTVRSAAGAEALLTVRLTVTGPAVTITAVQNGASFLPVISAGSWVTIKGSNLASTTRIWRGDEIVNGNLPVALDNVRVTFNGRDASVYYISPGQINVLAPDGLGTAPAVVEVSNGGRRSNALSVPVQPLAPAFFLFPQSYIAARHGSSFGILAKPELFGGCTASGCPSSAAEPGEVVLLYGTAFGATSPAIPAGRVVDQASLMTNGVRVSFGGRWVDAAGGLSGPGLYQINVTVPADLAEGDYEVTAEVGGQITQSGARLTVKKRQ